MRKQSILDTRNTIIKMMESGHYTPLQGWGHLKETWEQMTECQRTTDYCRGVIALDEHDKIDFMMG